MILRAKASIVAGTFYILRTWLSTLEPRRQLISLTNSGPWDSRAIWGLVGKTSIGVCYVEVNQLRSILRKKLDT